MQSTTAFLPNFISLNTILAMPGSAGTPKDKKHSSLSSKLELKGLVKPETASSTRIRFQCIEELFIILSSDVMSNTPFHM